MQITNAQYYVDEATDPNTNLGIKATIDDVLVHIPLKPGNRHYDEIMRLVESGELTIADAE